jgi:hypothetical protein
LSGYVDPAAYAPVVAQRVWSAAHTLLERHRRRCADPAGVDGVRPALPGREAQWQILLDALRDEGNVRQLARDRIPHRSRSA